jgi:signal transduction histidine kinase
VRSTIPYLLLAILVVFTVIEKHSTPGSLLIDLVICAVAAVWMLWMFTLHPAWRSRPTVMGIFVAGLIVLIAVLELRDTWFGFLVIAGYAFSFATLPWPRRLIAIAMVAVLSGTAQVGGLPTANPLTVLVYVVVVAVNVLTMSAAAWIMWTADEQSKQRKLALEKVNETNRRLEATLAENTRLHAQLIDQAREAGVRDERQRMAREIHDTLAQGLTGIITQLQAAEQAEDDPGEWRRHFDAATMLARDSLSEARRSVHALRPHQLEVGRLSEALTDVAQRWSALHDIPATVTTTGTARPMSKEAEFALLRTAQEALVNVAKHAHASRVGLTLSYLEHEIALDVRDDGRGFEPDQTGADTEEAETAGDTRKPEVVAGRDGGFGLVAMRQRIEGLSGTLQVESEPGFGTAISACIPAASVGVHA